MKDFKVQLASKFDDKRLKFPCLVSPKLDGIRAVFYKGKFYSRNQKVIVGMSHLIKDLRNFELTGVSLDGELMVPGLTFQVSSGKIRNYQETPDAVFNVFDIPSMDMSQKARIDQLYLYAERLESTHVKLVEHFLVHTHEEINKLYKVFREEGYEGAMVKNLHAPYENKRSRDWMKLKEVETYDVLCTGFFRGKGRLSDTLGGIIVELDGVPIRVGGGFSDADRDHIWRNKDYYRGMVCEVATQELTPSGSMRHPRLIRWRIDL